MNIGMNINTIAEPTPMRRTSECTVDLMVSRNSGGKGTVGGMLSEIFPPLMVSSPLPVRSRTRALGVVDHDADISATGHFQTHGQIVRSGLGRCRCCR